MLANTSDDIGHLGLQTVKETCQREHEIRDTISLVVTEGDNPLLENSIAVVNGTPNIITEVEFTFDDGRRSVNRVWIEPYDDTPVQLGTLNFADIDSQIRSGQVSVASTKVIPLS